MLEAVITHKDDKIISFEVAGHANFAPEGEDIYCAGVSAVTQTALLGLLKHLSVKPDYKIEPGYLFCELPPYLGENDNIKAQVILSTMETGLLSMEEAYSDFLKVVIRRC